MQTNIGAPYAGSGPLIALAATLGVALPLVACDRDEQDVRVPLGANMVAARRPTLAPPSGAPGARTIILATARLVSDRIAAGEEAPPDPSAS